jgi:carboxyl-terminal processing protease
MNDKYGKILFAVTTVLALVVGSLGGIVIDRQVLIPLSTPKQATTDQSLNYNLIQQAWNTIKQNYVDQSAVKPQVLTYGAISGMADALGDTGHTRFLTPQMVQQEHTLTQGSYEGIGANVSQVNGHVVIVSPIDGSPAQAAGLKAGDEILKVDGQDVTGLSLTEVINKILGPAGTTVTLTIFDPQTNQEHDVTVKRAKIVLHDVSWAPIPGTNFADVRLSGFNAGASSDLIKALNQIQGEHMAGIVLDMRSNPGGLLDEAVNVASQFLTSGKVLEEKNAKGEITPVQVKSGGVAPKIPMVVLIDNGTASAAEIVAGALQDNHRATLVGQTTFGTGTVLLEFPLSDGSALLLATQEWLTPSGHSIWHQGITPNVQVSLPTGASALGPDALKNMTAAQFKASQDEQMLKAVDLLTTQTSQ